MAKKSKTQRARASARRQARKEQGLQEENVQLAETSSEEKEGLVKRVTGVFKKPKDDKNASSEKSSKEVKPVKKDGFIANVRKEMGRVTWPTRTDVVRWTGVVVAALLFFGVYVFVLDNFIVTPLLMALASLGV